MVVLHFIELGRESFTARTADFTTCDLCSGNAAVSRFNCVEFDAVPHTLHGVY